MQRAQVVNDSTLLDLARNSNEYADVYSVIDPGTSNLAIKAYLKFGDGNKYYVLVGSYPAYIQYIDANQHKTLASEQIGGTDYAVMAGELPAAAEILSAAADYPYDVWSGKAPDETVSTSQIANYDSTDPGCLNDYPLLYGDINNDGNPELVIFQGIVLDIYSTSSNKLVFSELWHTADLAEPGKQNVIKNGPEKDQQGELARVAADYDSQGDKAPQYLADSGFDYNAERSLPAWKAFGKLYFGDFDGDKVPDIVMWRKLYESNLKNQPKGFHLKAQRYIHYRLVDGTYKLRDTPQPTIAGWMSANNLTWSDGYPDKSECKGHEGEPIPEMHDPLLNDPDVQ